MKNCFPEVTVVDGIDSELCAVKLIQQRKTLAGNQWLMPITLATWEAQRGRMTVQGPLGK
jgi:hypothetical protein